MGLKKYCIDGENKLDLDKIPTDSKSDKVEKEEIVKKTAKNQEKISELQERLYAEGREGLIIILQAIDAAGKDSIFVELDDVVELDAVFHVFEELLEDIDIER